MSTNTKKNIGYHGGTFTFDEIPTMGAFWAKKSREFADGDWFRREVCPWWSVAVEKFPCIAVLATSWFNNKTPISVGHECRMQ